MNANSTTQPLAIEVQQLVFRYGQRLALDHLDMAIAANQIFALLGPNGSGKSTLFRVLSTLESYREGQVRVLGMDVQRQPGNVRGQLGVVFQSPSLDPKLTVLENLHCQAALYGLRGQELARRIDAVASQLGLQARLAERVATLSGGLQRRVELAKGVLHRPRLLLMDEPSTGLDPASRLELWQALRELQAQHGVTVVLTTHLLEEADKADTIAILDQGRSVACGAPSALRGQLGARILSIRAAVPQAVCRWLEECGLDAQLQADEIRVTGEQVAELVAPLSAKFGERISSLSMAQPGLEDVFIARTGHHFNRRTSGED